MADAFISYGREDADFVHRLQEALKSREKSTWVDWEGIPPTAEWLQSVYAAIEQAEAFLFVISPDSVTSGVCAQELRHAVECGKKLVPVVHREVPPHRVPSELAARQWILLRDGDDLDAGLAALVEALDTDLAWVQLHTRLLVQAVEWEKRGRDNSFLLRGSSLAEAERWLAKGPVSDQPQTPLLTEYIIQSRRAASWRQRVMLAGVSVALGVALLLSVLLYVQYRETEERRRGEEQQRLVAEDRQREAVRQRDEATRAREGERQQRVAAERWATEAGEKARLARVRQLAAESRFLVGVPGNQEPALASAVLALALARGGDEQSLATASLHFALDRTRGPRLVRDGRTGRFSYDATTRSYVGSPDQHVVEAVISSASARAATLRQDGKGSLWDARSGKRLAELSLDGQPLASLSFLPGGDAVAGGDRRGLVRTWESRAGRLMCTSSGAAQPADPAAAPGVGDRGSASAEGACEMARDLIKNKVARAQVFLGSPFRSPDGSVTVLPSSREGVQLVNAKTGETIRTLMENTSRIDLVRISPDNKYVFTAGEGRPSVWEVATGRLRAILVGHGGPISAAEFSSDGRRIVTAGFDGTARVWGTESGRELLRLVGHVNRVLSAAFSEDDQWIVTASADGSGRVWNAMAGTVIGARRLHTSWIRGVAVSRDGDRVAIAGYDGPVRTWDLRLDTLSPYVAMRGQALSFSPDGREILAVGSDGLALARLSDGGVRRWSGGLRLISSAAFVPPGDRIVAISSSDGIAMWDLATGQRSWRVADPRAEGHRVLVSRGGGHVISAHAGSVRVWRIGDVAPSKEWKAHPRTITALALSTDGGRLLTAGDDGAARIWELERGRLLRTLEGHEGAITSGAFSPDGKLVLTTGSDATGRICSAESGKCLPVLSGHSGAVLEGAFSPDGQQVLTRGDDSTAKVWHVQSGQILESLGGHVGGMTAAVCASCTTHHRKRTTTSSSARGRIRTIRSSPSSHGWMSRDWPSASRAGSGSRRP